MKIPLDEAGDPIIDAASGQVVLDPVDLARSQNTIPDSGLAPRRPNEPVPSDIGVSSPQRRIVGRQPSNFRARQDNLKDKTFDEIRELGFEPERHNVLDLFRDGHP